MISLFPNGDLKSFSRTLLSVRSHQPILGFEYESRWRNHPSGVNVPNISKLGVISSLTYLGGDIEGISSYFPEPSHKTFNTVRLIGYILIANLIVGVTLIVFSIYTYFVSSRPINELNWVCLRIAARGALTFILGPLLIPFDIGKYFVQEYTLNNV